MDVNLLPSLKDWGGEEAIEKFKAIVDSTSLGLIDTSSANTANKGALNFQHYLLEWCIRMQ